MSPIRPLFHNPWLKPPGSQCYDAFAQWVGDTLRGKVARTFDRHPRPPRLEKVKRPDGRGYQFIGHRPEGITSVRGLVNWVRESRPRRHLLPGEVEFLRKHLVRTLSPIAFRDWLSDARMAELFFEDDWNREQNHRKFGLYVMACFMESFHSGQIDWRTPNTNDMQQVAKLVNMFVDSNDTEKQGELIRGLFDPGENVKGIAARASTGLSRKDRELLLECRDLSLKGEARARWLQEHGFKGFGKSPLTKYRENPDSMRAQLSAWTSFILEV
jgi:hypothetical protein